ncbi:molybdenum cofactor biosynthesis protein MoaE [Spirochaetota bacterium]
MKKFIFQKEPIEQEKVLAQIGTDNDGAIVSFIGQARKLSKDKEVKYLEYEIYESMAGKELEKIINSAYQNWSLNSCIVIHRYGKVNIGEASILIALSSPHREEAYKASRYIIDTIKKTVPIWKKEFYTDNSSWISDRS